MTEKKTTLAICDLSVSVTTAAPIGVLLDKVSLEVGVGEIVGLVGESGCGKSTSNKAILGVLPGNASVTGGEIFLGNENLLKFSENELNRRIRGSRIGFTPQDPYLSLNPLFRIETQLLEIMRWHAPDARPWRRAEHRRRPLDVLRSLQIPDPEAALRRFPHEFSGGQRQRLMIAGALVCHPQIIVADEPTSALEVTAQRQILALLNSAPANCRRLFCL